MVDAMLDSAATSSIKPAAPAATTADQDEVPADTNKQQREQQQQQGLEVAVGDTCLFHAVPRVGNSQLIAQTRLSTTSDSMEPTCCIPHVA
jgi:co-chaperonin GroES (HSP10)